MIKTKKSLKNQKNLQKSQHLKKLLFFQKSDFFEKNLILAKKNKKKSLFLNIRNTQFEPDPEFFF